METSSGDLADRYRVMSTDILRRLHKEGGLTEEANKLLIYELRSRCADLDGECGTNTDPFIDSLPMRWYKYYTYIWLPLFVLPALIYGVKAIILVRNGGYLWASTLSATGARSRCAGSRWCPPRSGTLSPRGTSARWGSPCCSRRRRGSGGHRSSP